jgi:hypothetical protein
MAILLAMAVAFLIQESQIQEAHAAAPPILHQRPILASPAYASEDTRITDEKITDGRIDADIVATWKRGATDFPADAAGFYRFRDDAQGVRIVSHDGDISGYLLKFGKGSSDKDMVLGYLFSDVAGNRNRLYFTTRQVHGVWYGFEGQVVPHRGLNHSDPANYILQGTLTMHDEAQQAIESATVRLRYAGQH